MMMVSQIFVFSALKDFIYFQIVLNRVNVYRVPSTASFAFLITIAYSAKISILITKGYVKNVYIHVNNAKVS